MASDRPRIHAGSQGGGGHLGSKHLAAWQVAFWVSLVASHFLGAQTAPKKRGPKTERGRREGFGAGPTFDQDIKGLVERGRQRTRGFSCYGNFIAVNIALGVAAAIDGGKHTRYNQLNKIRPDTHTRPPRYLILSHTQRRVEGRRPKAARVNVCLNASAGELEINK